MQIKVSEPRIQTVKIVFILFAAMNALGYDEENNPRGMSPERRVVCRVLFRRSWHGPYAVLVRRFKKNHPWHLLHTVLFARSRNLFVSQLRKFAQEPEIKELWRTLQPSLLKKEQTLTSVFKREATRLIVFLRREPHPIKKKISLIFNPLDAYWRGYSFVVGDGGYMVVGPGTAPETTRLIRHELLHFLAPRITIPRGFTSPKMHRRKGNKGYSNRSVIAREYVVRGLNLLYEREVLHENIVHAVSREKKQFPHIRTVLKLLKKQRSHS